MNKDPQDLHVGINYLTDPNPMFHLGEVVLVLRKTSNCLMHLDSLSSLGCPEVRIKWVIIKTKTPGILQKCVLILGVEIIGLIWASSRTARG